MADKIKDIYSKGSPWYNSKQGEPLRDQVPSPISRFGMESADVASFTTTQLVFSTYQSNANAANFGNEPEGFVHYVDNGSDAVNKVVYLPFFLEEGFVVKTARVQVIANDTLTPLNAQIRLDSATLYLNPVKTKITTGLYDYYRFSGGSTIRAGISPSADGSTYEIILDYPQIKAMNVQNQGSGSTGWNTIVFQQDNNDTAGDAYAGLASVTLIIYGHSSKI